MSFSSCFSDILLISESHGTHTFYFIIIIVLFASGSTSKSLEGTSTIGNGHPMESQISSFLVYFNHMLFRYDAYNIDHHLFVNFN